MSISLITGHKATNHISAAADAAFTAAFIGADNYVIDDEKNVTLSVDPDTGTVTVGAFSALFSGRKIVSTGDTETYTMPAAGKYKRVSIGLTYTKDTNDDDVEDCVLSCYVSADNATASGAAGDSTNAPNDTTITSATTEAYFELFDLVVSDSAVMTNTVKYSISNTVDSMNNYVETARLQYTICDLDHVTTSGLYFKESGGGSVTTFLSDKRFAIMVFRASLDPAANAVCAYVIGAGNNVCMPTLIEIGGTDKHFLFSVSLTANDEISLGNTYVGDMPSFSTIPFNTCRIYAWR